MNTVWLDGHSEATSLQTRIGRKAALMLLQEVVISHIILQTVRVIDTHALQHMLQHSSTGTSATLLLHFITIIAQVFQYCEKLRFRHEVSVINAVSAQQHWTRQSKGRKDLYSSMS